MTIHKPSRFDKTAMRIWMRQEQSDATTRRVSALIGAGLVGLTLLWCTWLYLHQVNPGWSFFFLGNGQNGAKAASDPLVAAGITLSAPEPGQEPSLTRQQALLLANQLEPDIAARTNAVNAQYTLASYKGVNPSQLALSAIPVWLVHYTNISEPRPDTSADAHATHVQHDFYVFLAASSGRELLAIWL